VKKWPLQLRRSMPDGMAASTNGASLQQQEMSLIQERTLPSSPSLLYSPLLKASGYMKGGLGQPSSRKQLMGGHTVVDNSRGMLQWVQSITFVTISVDHSLHLMFQADMPSPGKMIFFPSLSFFISPQCIHIQSILMLLLKKFTFFFYCLLHLLLMSLVATFYQPSYFLGCGWTPWHSLSVLVGNIWCDFR